MPGASESICNGDTAGHDEVEGVSLINQAVAVQEGRDHDLYACWGLVVREISAAIPVSKVQMLVCVWIQVLAVAALAAVAALWGWGLSR